MERNPNCTACPLHKGCKTVCVWSRGPVTSNIMLIGEAPGEHEDDTGQPFVGPSGRRLNLAMLAVGLHTPYITNVVKCRPPENRTPSPDEMTACANLYLYNQIKEVKPKVIVTLGKVATSEFVPTLLARGIEFQYLNLPAIGFEIILIPTWHPSYVLRQAAKGDNRPYEELKKALSLAKGFGSDNPS